MTDTPHPTPPADTAAMLADALALQRSAYFAAPVPSLAQRRQDLLALRRFVCTHRSELVQAISQDYGHRSAHETELMEVMPVLHGIDHALRHLRRWMRPQRRPISRMLFGTAHNRLQAQPLGVVGVIVPWNFPLNLSLLPLCSIFAAGNRAMVKMSEQSPHLAALLQAHMPGYFGPDKLRFFADDSGMGPAFSALPFDHLLFTGSTATGRAVMASAARNLCPVTLELGGRSPAVVCQDFDVATAAQRISYAKFLNAGQLCLSVDHVYVPHDKVDAFVRHAQAATAQRYANLSSPDYTSVIGHSAYRRLTQALDEAQARGATVLPLLPGAARDDDAHRLGPHLVLNAPPDCALMQGEIFGPILPVLGYSDLAQVVGQINSGTRPLAFYPFTHQREVQAHLLDHVMSGGVSVNDALLHAAQTDLPFGGVGASGMGHYHGKEGFDNFSKLRPIFYQSRWSVMALMSPPYGQTVNALLKLLNR